MDRSLPKSERLSSETAIKELFANGCSVFNYPLRVIFNPRPDGDVSRIMAVVPKKRFKSAVDRNHIKRKIKEAYRLNKQPICHDIAFIYVSGDDLPFVKIEQAVVKSLHDILNPCSKTLSKRR